MADTEKKVILGVSLDAEGFLKKAADVKTEIDQLKAEQKSLDRTTEEGAVQFETLGLRIRELQTEYRNYQKQAQNTNKATNAQTDSIKQLEAQLSIAREAYNNLSGEARRTADGMALQNTINQITDSLKEARRGVQDYRMEVGSYEVAIQNAQVKQALWEAGIEQTNGNLNELRRRLRELQNISFADKTVEEQAKITKAISDTRTQISDFQAHINGIDTDNLFNNISQGTNTIIQGFNVLNTTLASLGVEGESLAKINKNLATLIATTQAFNVVYQFVNKNKLAYLSTNLKVIASDQAEALAKRISTLRTTEQTVAENASIITKARLTVAIQAATAAQRIWNTVILANPLVALVATVAAVTLAVVAFTAALNTQTKEQENATAAQREYNRVMADTEAQVRSLQNSSSKAIEQARLDGRKQLSEARAAGATKEQLAKIEYDNAKRIRDLQIEAGERLQDTLRAQYAALQANLSAQQALLSTLKQGTKAYSEQVKVVNQLTQAISALTGEINREYFALQNLYQDQIDADHTFTQTVKTNSAARTDDTAAKLQKSLQDQKAFNEARIKAEADYQSQDFKTRQKYALRLQELTDEAERNNLAIQRKYNKITQDEYDTQIGILDNKRTEFLNGQVAALNEYVKNIRTQFLQSIEKDVDESIAAIEIKYENLIKQLDKLEPPQMFGQSEADYQKELDEYNKFVFQRAQYEIRLEEQKQNEIKEIRDRFDRQRTILIEQNIRKEFNDELALARDNEAARLEIQREALQKQIAQKKEAGLRTLEDEIALDITERQIIANRFEFEILKAGDSWNKRYQLRKEYLNKELEYYEGNVQKQLEIMEELRELEQEFLMGRIELYEDWANTITSIANDLNTVFKNLGTAEINRYKKENDTKKKELKKRLNADLITQEQYNDQVAKLDEDLDAKKLEIERKQAKREKAIKVFSIVTDTAAGIAKAIAQSPLTYGLPYSAFMAAMGAAQLAAVLSEPLPVAARGMLVGGNSHANGGTRIEAERGEVIINKQSASMFMPLLSAINQAGGGVPFTSAGSDGGFTSRSLAASNSVTANDIASAVREAVEGIQPVLAIEDYRRADKKYTRIVNNGKLF